MEGVLLPVALGETEGLAPLESVGVGVAVALGVAEPEGVREALGVTEGEGGTTEGKTTLRTALPLLTAAATTASLPAEARAAGCAATPSAVTFLPLRGMGSAAPLGARLGSATLPPPLVLPALTRPLEARAVTLLPAAAATACSMRREPPVAALEEAMAATLFLQLASSAHLMAMVSVGEAVAGPAGRHAWLPGTVEGSVPAGQVAAHASAPAGDSRPVAQGKHASLRAASAVPAPMASPMPLKVPPGQAWQKAAEVPLGVTAPAPMPQ